MLSIKSILFLFLFSCTDFLGTYEGYEIKKGHHASRRSGMTARLLPSLTEGRHMRFDAIFTQSCIYIPKDSSINKLYGFTDCNSGVHGNSVRFGWRVDQDLIDIFAYWYEDRQFNYQWLGSTTADHEDQYELWAKDNVYWFRFNDKEFAAPRSKNCEHGIRVRCFPWFGGPNPAPQEMMIYVFEYN